MSSTFDQSQQTKSKTSVLPDGKCAILFRRLEAENTFKTDILVNLTDYSRNCETLVQILRSRLVGLHPGLYFVTVEFQNSAEPSHHPLSCPDSKSSQPSTPPISSKESTRPDTSRSSILSRLDESLNIPKFVDQSGPFIPSRFSRRWTGFWRSLFSQRGC